MNMIEHLIQCLGEEGIEVALEFAKCASKANRFGLDDRNVLNPDGPTNRERLIIEANELIAVMDMCAEAGILPKDWQTSEQSFTIQLEKQKKVRKYMNYAREKGALVGDT